MTYCQARPGRRTGGIMSKIKVALVGVGNCASSLVQGRYFYADRKAPAGLMHERIGGYAIGDIEFVLAIDTDARKVGSRSWRGDLRRAQLHDRLPARRSADRGHGAHGPGAGRHGAAYGRAWRARLRPRRTRPRRAQDEIVATLKESGAEMLVNFLPVGSRGGDPILHGVRARRRASRWSTACRCSSPASRNGSGASARSACRSSATTSRRNWARPSSTASFPASSARAASAMTAPISSTPAAIPTS